MEKKYETQPKKKKTKRNKPDFRVTRGAIGRKKKKPRQQRLVNFKPKRDGIG